MSDTAVNADRESETDGFTWMTWLPTVSCLLAYFGVLAALRSVHASVQETDNLESWSLWLILSGVLFGLLAALWSALALRVVELMADIQSSLSGGGPR